MVKHTGLNPVENTSATSRGRTRVSHRGRPAARRGMAGRVGRAAHNPVLGAKFARLTRPPSHGGASPVYSNTAGTLSRRCTTL
jgi:hypothetical protein